LTRLRAKARQMTAGRRAPEVDLRTLTLAELEAQRYTHLTWTCAMCQWLCSQGLRLMRIRRQTSATSTIATIAASLRCPKCRHRPDVNAVNPTKA
jgi:hypothetical protein